MTPRALAFAVPGDIDRRTGGYIYDKNLIAALRAQGRRVDLISLPASFPDAPPADMAAAIAALTALPPDLPVIVDGLALGAMDPAGVARMRAPLVAFCHHPLGLETGLPPARAAALIACERANLARAAHVLVPSPHTGRILTADFGVDSARITVALPGFPPPDPLRHPATPPLILAVGLIAARKGHDVLIRALGQITDLDWQAVIVGSTVDAALAADLEALRVSLGLAPRLRIGGEVGAEALRDLYRSATVFALATRYEGYGMVFAEALGHGLPIVATAGGAVADTVPPDAGILVPVNDDAGVAGALRTVLTDAPRRTAMATAATAAAARLPSWADTAARVSAVLDRLPS
jgi:glycosyltransferase involved in cell wall biosynthesis